MGRADIAQKPRHQPRPQALPYPSLRRNLPQFRQHAWVPHVSLLRHGMNLPIIILIPDRHSFLYPLKVRVILSATSLVPHGVG
jgi:hypothetical protein